MSVTTDSLPALTFDNRFTRELPGDPELRSWPRQVRGAAFTRVRPTPIPAPQLIAWSPDVAALVGLSPEAVVSEAFAAVFGGNALAEGMDPYAANYGGHQFGQWAGQLGDGRAITLGEVINRAGERWELQLKGAGPTPYSRSADGRAVLRSSIREFLCSEAMHHLGVPTTRALSIVATGEPVVRDMFYDGHPKREPGAIVCRVAPSFIRFGTFELPASRRDTALLTQLIDFTISRDFPELAAALTDRDVVERRGAWFSDVCERTAVMVAEWMRVGFVHGVMNTDNMSILGLTIDYGPYGWVDNFDPDWTPNTTDAATRRYRFGQQPEVAAWNLMQLAEALLPAVDSPQTLMPGLTRFREVYAAARQRHLVAKLGLRSFEADDLALMESLESLMVSAEVDMTLFFRGLADIDLAKPGLDPLRTAFYDPTKMRDLEPAFAAWLSRYAARAARDARPALVRKREMNAVNPRYVLRNYLAQQAIDQAELGDPSMISELLEVLRRPYDDQPGADSFAERRPDWARTRAGCSMLSCSS